MPSPEATNTNCRPPRTPVWLARASAVQPQIEAGQVYLPRPRVPDGRAIPGRGWVEDFVGTCAVFPKGAHDDDVDALTQLLVRWADEPFWMNTSAGSTRALGF